MTLPYALAKLARLMSPELSETLDPIRLARAGARFEGSLKFNDMERLCAHLSETEGEAEYTLHFTRDDNGHYCVSGRIFAQIQLICQRCLGPVKNSIETKTNLMLVKNLEDARKIPEEFEPLITEQMITLKGLIEDELLLALPTVPIHKIENCPVKLESEVYEQKRNSFAELSKLQVKNRSK